MNAILYIDNLLFYKATPFFRSPSGDLPTRPDKAVERSDDRLIG
jgi:hypothetical protein